MNDLLAFSAQIELRLGKLYSIPVKVLRSYPVSGGCINHAHRLETTCGNFFLKFNSSSRYPGMFEAEAKGLNLLNETNTIRVPEVIFTGEQNAWSFILLEHIESAAPLKNYWNEAGRKLALLHRKSNSGFGLDHDNYIGSLSQWNTFSADWISFFIKERLLATGKEIVEPYQEKIERFMSDSFPAEPPALLHGDLWNGNIMTGPEGAPVFFDPAVYYGHREMDLAMTRLFGGFPEEFYRAYEEEYPLAPGFKNRVDICNLYPLLVHVKLFGGSYLHQVKSILSKL